MRFSALLPDRADRVDFRVAAVHFSRRSAPSGDRVKKRMRAPTVRAVNVGDALARTDWLEPLGAEAGRPDVAGQARTPMGGRC
jgi:hypothetical protein